MKLKPWIAVIAALGCTAAQAADSIQLNKYVVTGTYALDPLNGTGAGISGLEASAVTYARDRGTLFFVGDEGRGVVEISRTGQTIGNNLFNWAGTGSTNNDTEALTYLGNGRLVVGEERLQNAYSFDYVANATVNLASTPFVSFGPPSATSASRASATIRATAALSPSNRTTRHSCAFLIRCRSQPQRQRTWCPTSLSRAHQRCSV